MKVAGDERTERSAVRLVHTLAVRSMGPGAAADEVVRAVWAGAGDPSDADSMLADAVERVSRELRCAARARLGPVEGSVEAAALAASVEAQARSLTLAAAVERFDPIRREVVERVLLHGDSCEDLALMTGQEPEAIEWELAEAVAHLARLAEDPRRTPGHPEPRALAAYGLAGCGQVVDLPPGTGEHVATCARCGDDARRCGEVVDALRAGAAGEGLVEPDDALWADLERRAAARGTDGTPAPGADAAAHAERRQHRRRTALVGAALVVALLLAGLAVVAVPGLLDGREDPTVSRAELVDPRTGFGAGEAVVIATPNGQMLVVDGPFEEASDASYELWLVTPAGVRRSLGVVDGGHHAVILAAEGDAGPGAMVEVMREAWDGSQDSDVDVVARGVMR